ncbi:Pentatricopeptide repeat-containing protein, chloroplastic [Heracleum sosnowskyi]|uniref:Pentatricopeptide repeat-containing protein, chloroplastic n=1 Tax=Heracleum sosnowskyi TaxID=360622 RepID=A0AAD8H4R9_9APIA|nr:Pentatricopeptide repeat-containing protein, chloroplastic [Heracleum sosnowskyi]
MQMALNHCFFLLPPPLSTPHSLSSNFHHNFKSLHLPSLSATSNSSQSSSIFLPHLQENQQQDPVQESPLQPTHDPFLKFFKARVSAPEPDPTREGKLTLQKNRRTSWHLAEDINSQGVEPDFPGPDPKPDPEDDPGCGDGDGSVVYEILKLAKSLPENNTLGEVLRGYEGNLGKTECVKVLDLMGKENGLVLSCLYFFEWMGLQEPSLISARACSVMFVLLGRAGMGDKLMLLFRNLPNGKQFREAHVFTAAISGLFSCGRYDDAWRVYETMESNDVQPDHVTCSIMITIMRKTGKSAKDAWEFFTKSKTKWTIEVIGAVIKSFCDEGMKKEALIIQEEMEKKGIASNAIVYNTLMDAYGKSNQVEEAEGLFAEMNAKGIVPTVATYNILMDAYKSRIQPEIIEKLLIEMKTMGLEPNVKSYTCLISAYGRQKNMSDMAADAFLRMKKAGVEPTSHSYTALINAYSLNGWHEKAYMAFESMLGEGLKPSIETYTAVLDAFRRAGDTQTLMKIWKMMIRDKIEGTRVTFNILLDGFAKQGHYTEARDVISEFGKIGYKPTVMTYNMLINAYARGGQDLKIPQLLNEMKGLNLKPDSVTYSTMIYAFVRVRDFKRAFFYHKQMVKSGQLPDAKSYEKLRSILDVKAATKNKKDKSAILGIINSRMGVVKIKKKTKKDEFWKNKTKRSKTNGSKSSF